MDVVTQKPSWFRANRKIILVVGGILSLGVCVALVVMVFGLLGNSDVSNLAFATANSNPTITERLGHPLKKGWFVSGSIEVNPASGHAELAIPISGPKGKGTLYAEAHKQAGLWHMEILQFGSEDSNERINLIVADAGTKPASP